MDLFWTELKPNGIIYNPMITITFSEEDAKNYQLRVQAHYAKAYNRLFDNLKQYLSKQETLMFKQEIASEFKKLNESLSNPPRLVNF
jgi:hypothetical protein